MSSSIPSSNLPRSSSGAKVGEFYCGCAGFANNTWINNFYPRKLVGSDSDRQLNHYQQHFNSVEINATFYGLPSESTIEKWKRNAAKGFKYVLKAHQNITHEESEDKTEPRQLNVENFEIFVTRAMKLGSCLEVILLQCPKTLNGTIQNLEAIKQVVDRVGYQGKLALEFRHFETYRNQAIRKFLTANDWSLVYHPNSLGSSTKKSTTGSPLVDYEIESLEQMAKLSSPTARDWVYCRLHGTNDGHRSEYNTKQLDEIAKQIHSWRSAGFSVYAFILNDLEPTTDSTQNSENKARKRKASFIEESWSAMPKNAQQLKRRVYALADEALPRAPKQPRNTITSFFGKKT